MVVRDQLQVILRFPRLAPHRVCSHDWQLPTLLHDLCQDLLLLPYSSATLPPLPGSAVLVHGSPPILTLY